MNYARLIREIKISFFGLRLILPGKLVTGEHKGEWRLLATSGSVSEVRLHQNCFQ